MGGNFLQAFQQDVLERSFGKYSTVELTASTLWLHLYATTLNDAATPATTGRCPGANYTPLNVVNTTAQWTSPTAATTSVTQNKAVLTYTTNASTGWGTVNSIMISSSSGTGGVGYAWGDLSTAQTIASGNTVRLSTGTVVIGLS